MNQTQFLARLSECYAENVEISRAKNADYANDGDPFQNFRLIDALTGGKVSVEEGLLVRMSDKLQRVANLLNRPGQVKDESVSDTLSDLANYAMILRIYREQLQVLSDKK